MENLLILAAFVSEHDLDFKGTDSCCFYLVVNQCGVASVLSFAGCFYFQVLHFLILIGSDGLDKYYHLGKLLLNSRLQMKSELFIFVFIMFGASLVILAINTKDIKKQLLTSVQ